MADPTVHITNGLPDLGTGNITTLGQTIAVQGSLTSSQSTGGPLVQGAVTTAPPVYTTGTINPLSMDGSGNLRVLVGNASVTVSGNVGASQLGAPWSQNISQFGGSAVVTGTGISGVGIPRVTVASDSSLAATQSGTWNLNNISGTISLPTGAATAAKQPALGTAGAPSADVITVQGVAGGTAQPVSIAAAVTVVQPTAANLQATVTGTVAVSGVASVKPDGTVWTLTGSSANVQVSGGTLAATQSGNWTSRIVGNVGGVLDAAQNAAAPANELVVGGVYNSVAPTITSGNASQLQLDANGNLNVNIKAGGGAGGTSSSVGGATPGTGTLALGAVTTGSPSYTTATANALSLDTSGNLRVNVVAGGAGGGAVFGPTAVGSAAANPPVLMGGTASGGAAGNVQVARVSASGLVSVTLDGSSATLPVSIAATVGVNGSAVTNADAVATNTASVPAASYNYGFNGTTWDRLQVDASKNLKVLVNAALPTGGNVIGAVTQSGGPWTVSQATAANLNATVTGTVAATQSGNWTSRVVGNAGGILDAAQNAAAPANELVVGGVYNSVAPTITSGNATQLQTDVNGFLKVNVAAGGAAGGTSSNFSATFPTVGTAAGAEYLSSPPTLTTGQMVALQTDINGNLKVNIQAGAGSGGTAIADEAAFTAGTTQLTLGGGFFQTTATNNALTTGQAGTFQLTANRALFTNLRNAAGTEVGTAGAALRIDPVGTTTQPVSGTVTANQGGAPWTVKPDASAWTLTGTSANVNLTNASIAATQSGNWTSWIRGSAGAILDSAQNTAAPGSVLSVGGTYNSAAPTLTSGNTSQLQLTSAGSLHTTVDNSVAVTGTFWQATQPVSGTVTANQGGAPWSENITQFGGSAVVTGTGASGAGIPRVTISNDSTFNPQTIGSWGLQVSTQNSATPTNGQLAMGQFNTAPTTITTGNVSPLQLTSAARLIVDGSQVTQPVSIAATVATNVAQFGGSAVVTGTGAGGAGIPRVTISNDSTVNPQTIGTWGLAASTQNVATPTNGQLVMGEFNTSPTAITSGNSSPLQLDTNGNLLVNIKAGGGAGGTSSSVGAAMPGTATVAMGSVTTAAPTYTTATANALSLDTAGNLRVSTPAVTATGPVWNNATGANTTYSVANNPTVLGQLTVTTTITAGAVTFEESYDLGTTWVAVPAGRLVNPATGAQIANPYTLVASTNLQFEIISTGTTQMRIRLSTAITGTGSASIFLTSSPLLNEVQVYQNNATNLLSTAEAVCNAGLPTYTAGTTNPLVTNTSGQLLTSTVVSSGNVTVNGTASVSQVGAPWSFHGDTASGSADANNPVKIGAVARTANPTAVSGGQRVNLMADKLGKLITNGAVRELKGKTRTSITTTTETTVVAAVAATFNDVYSIVVTNRSATACVVDIRDSTGGTIQMSIAVPAGETRGWAVPVDSAIPQTTVNNNWTATLSAAVTSINITMLYVANI
jgi:hypothetical protein